jgi:hypothetical protein
MEPGKGNVQLKNVSNGKSPVAEFEGGTDI